MLTKLWWVHGVLAHLQLVFCQREVQDSSFLQWNCVFFCARQQKKTFCWTRMFSFSLCEKWRGRLIVRMLYADLWRPFAHAFVEWVGDFSITHKFIVLLLFFFQIVQNALVFSYTLYLGKKKYFWLFYSQPTWPCGAKWQKPRETAAVSHEQKTEKWPSSH